MSAAPLATLYRVWMERTLVRAEPDKDALIVKVLEKGALVEGQPALGQPGWVKRLGGGYIRAVRLEKVK